MSAIAAAVIGTAIIGGVISSKSASKAADAQTYAADAAAAEARAAREELRTLMEPYVAAGTPGLQKQLNLLGLGTEQSQADAIAEQERSPLFQALARQGEDAILQNASATGGLRGGNTQGALAQFRPQLLDQFISQQYERLGGITRLGQNSAAGVGAAGLESANSIGAILQNKGAAIAGGALAQGQAWNNALGTIGGFAASPLGAKAFGKIF